MAFHVHYHVPRADTITPGPTFSKFVDALEYAQTEIKLDQYMALIEEVATREVCRYLITPGCGTLSCIPQQGEHFFDQKLSNIVNFVMANDDGYTPYLPCEEDY